MILPFSRRRKTIVSRRAYRGLQDDMAVGTPFHSRTAPLCTSLNWKQWSGYFAANAYDDFHDPEYHAIRNGAGLIDISPLYKYDVRGPDARRLVDRLITRDVHRCGVGQVIYAPWCDHAGHVIQDGTIQRLAESAFRITAADPSLPWFELSATGMDVEVVDVSEQVAALAIQGPTSRTILARVADGDVSALPFFALMRARLGGVPVIVSRTGYTGDLGYELWAEAADAERLWDVLIEAGAGLGICPAGLMALDLVRIEAGLPLIDVDFLSSEKALIPAQKSSPYEIGLGWAVHLGKPAFNGKRSLTAMRARGAAQRLVGIEVTWKEVERVWAGEGLSPELSNVASRAGLPLYAGDRQIGKVTSSCWSRLLKTFIGLATIESGHAAPGQRVQLEMTVQYMRKRASATVVKLPFFDPPRKRE